MALTWEVRVQRNCVPGFGAAFSGGAPSEWLVKLEAVAAIASVTFRRWNR